MLTLFFKKIFDFFFSLTLSFSFTQSLISSRCPIHFSFLFSYGSNAKPSLFKKKKKSIVERQCWDVAQESWRCERHTNKKNYHGIRMAFFIKKKKKSSTNPKRKIVVATSYLSKPDGQVGVIGSVWIEFIVSENWKLKTENTVAK